MRCQTASPVTVAVYSCLVAVFVAGGLLMLGAGSVTSNGGLQVGGFVFGAFGVYQGHEILYSTAHLLSVDPAQQVLAWKSVLGRGSVPVASLGAITRAPTRPDVYVFRIAVAGTIPFWLSKRDESVGDFFRTLERMNPDLEVSDLYRRGLLWWKGL